MCLLQLHPDLCSEAIWSWRSELVERLIAVGEKYSLNAHYTGGLALKGELMIARGEVDAGVGLLRNVLARLHTADTIFSSCPGFACTRGRPAPVWEGSGGLDGN